MDTQVQLAYMSRAALVFTQSSLDEMLRAARTHNLNAGISGLLLYKCGYFLQVLEGPVARVDALYDRIRQDPRHTKVQLMLRRENVARQFKTWSMAFVEADSVPTPGLDELVIQAANNVPASRSSQYISAIIADFKNNDYNPRPQAKMRPVVCGMEI